MAVVVRVHGGRRGATTRDTGQALVLCLLLAGAAALASLLLFNSGLLANTKTQLQNAADAGAYSGAVMLARDHNFSAYANRAMVANQVAVAQLVSLKSYLEDAASTQGRLNDTVQARQARIPVANPLWPIAQGVPIGAANTAYGKIAGGAVKSLDTLIATFAKAQRAHHEATAASVMFIVDEVVKKNDPNATVSKGAFEVRTLAQVAAWRNDYTKEHAANDSSAAANRFANVVVNEQSTDQFIRNRKSTPLPQWAAVPRSSFCPGGRPIWTSYSFDHRGATILSSDKKRWLALDASEGDGIAVCIYMVGKIPVPYWRDFSDPSKTHGSGGSGGAVAGREGRYNDRNGFSGNPATTRQYGNALVEVRRPAMSRYNKGPGATLDKDGGLQDTYRDLADFTSKPLNQSPELNGGQVPLTVEVVRNQETVRTSSTFLGGATNIRIDPRMKGATMRTLSSAHAFFYRPNLDSGAFTKTGWRRADNRTELANLFNPYWQARLRDRTELERGASFGAQ